MYEFVGFCVCIYVRVYYMFVCTHAPMNVFMFICMYAYNLYAISYAMYVYPFARLNACMVQQNQHI